MKKAEVKKLVKKLQSEFFNYNQIASQDARYSGYGLNHIGKCKKIVDFIIKEVYNGNTAKDKIIEKFNISEKAVKKLNDENWTIDAVTKQKLDFDELQQYLNAIMPEVSKNIENAWENKAEVIDKKIKEILGINE